MILRTPPDWLRWREPVHTAAELPTDGECGDAIVVIDENTIYIWDCDSNSWVPVSGGGGGSDEKVKVSSNDTTANYLGDKLVAGTNVTLEVLNEGGNEQIRISAAGGGVAGSDKEVQFNKSGSFGSDPHFKYDYNNYTLILNNADYGPWIQTYNSTADMTHEWWVVESWTYKIDAVTIFDIGNTKASFYSDAVVINSSGVLDLKETSQPSSESGKGRLFVDNGDGHIKFVASDGTVYDLTQGGGGVTTFTELTDTPSSYTGAAGQFVKVNATEDGLEFSPGVAGNDMEVQFNKGGEFGSSPKFLYDYNTDQVQVKTDMVATRIWLYDNQDPTQPAKSYFGIRPNTSIRRVIFYGEPDGGDTFGFILSPNKADKTYNTFFGFWNTDFDQGSPPGASYAGVLLEPDGSLKFFSWQNRVYFAPSNTEGVYFVKNNNKAFVGINNDSPSEALTVGKAGDGTRAIANEWATFSDKRLKTDIEELTDALPLVKKIRPVKYRYVRDEKKRTRIGVIAQELIDIVPEAVAESDGILAIDYNQLVPLLIQAVKELAARVEELEAKLRESTIMGVGLDGLM